MTCRPRPIALPVTGGELCLAAGTYLIDAPVVISR